MTQEDNQQIPDPPRDDGVLSPEEVDVEQKDEVEEIDNNRYLVPTDGEPAETLDTTDTIPDTPQTDTENLEDAFRASVADISEQYAIEAAAKSEHGVDNYHVATNNVVDAFEKFLRWYLTQLSKDEPELALEILLKESDFNLSVVRDEGQ